MTPILRRILQLLVLVAIQAFLLFLSAGTFRWPAAWWYLGLYIVMLVVASFIMIPNRPEVIAERGRGTRAPASTGTRPTRTAPPAMIP